MRLTIGGWQSDQCLTRTCVVVPSTHRQAAWHFWVARFALTDTGGAPNPQNRLAHHNATKEVALKGGLARSAAGSNVI